MVSALAATYFLKLAARNLKKVGLSPIKKSLEFEALVARVAAPDIGRAEEQDPRELYDVAHALRDSRTIVAGSPVRDGPYGDLFHRVLHGWGVVIDLAYQSRLGYPPQIDPIDTVDPPALRLFLDDAVGRFSDALTRSPTGTTDGRFPQSLYELAARHEGEEPRLVAALRGEPPFVASVQGQDYYLPLEEYLDMTNDEQLSQVAASAQPV